MYYKKFIINIFLHILQGLVGKYIKIYIGHVQFFNEHMLLPFVFFMKLYFPLQFIVYIIIVVVVVIDITIVPFFLLPHLYNFL